MNYTLIIYLLVMVAWAPALCQAQLSADQSNVLFAISRGLPVDSWPELTPAQAAGLATKAEAYLAQYQRFHQPYGLTADVLFSGRDRAKVLKLDGLGDSATWTGHYLAALACRYAVTSDPATSTEIGRVLGALEVLTHVSGRNGYIARFAGRAEDSAYRPYYSVYGHGADKDRPGFGTWAYPGAGQYTNLVWLGNSSRDTYLGVNLGLATALRLVSEPNHNQRLCRLIQSIVDRFLQDGWIIDDGQGHQTTTTPLLKAALLRTATTANPRKYQRLYESESTSISAAPPVAQPEHYYSNNLQVIACYVLATLETDPAKKAQYQQELKVLWESLSRDLNAWFAAVYMSATGDVSNVVARATLQGCLTEYPDPPRWPAPVDNSSRPDIEIIEFGGKPRAKYALPLVQRPVSDFIWQRSPFDLKGGTTEPLEYPGLDLFLPYWMARTCGVLRDQW